MAWRDKQSGEVAGRLDTGLIRTSLASRLQGHGWTLGGGDDDVV